MSYKANLDHSAIKSRAVAMGRSRGLNAEADRLEASNPSAHIEKMVAELREDAMAQVGASHVVDALAARLWGNWMAVEYNMATVLERLAQEPGVLRKANVA